MSRGDIRLRAPSGATYNQIGQRLRARRLQLKLTQDNICGRLAEITGRRWIADRFDVMKLEKGTRTATDLEIYALALAIECDPLWLFSGDMSPAARSQELMQNWVAQAIVATNEEE